MSKLTPIALSPAAAPTATATSAAVEISDFTGIAQLVLDAAAAPAGQTLDVKLQHSSDNGVADAYADAGFAFTQVTAAGASFQTQTISVDGLKKYVKVVRTIAGGTTAHPHGVYLVGNKAR